MLDRDILSEFATLAADLDELAQRRWLDEEWVDATLDVLNKLERIREHLRGAREQDDLDNLPTSDWFGFGAYPGTK